MPVAEYISRPDGLAFRLASPDLPRMPDLSAGRCTSGVNPDLWASRDREERQAAILICRSCPVLPQCREWALALPSTAASMIVGGMTATERIRIRHERAQAAAAEAEAARLAAPWGMPKINSAKIACKRGHELAGENVVMVRGRGGKLFRRCRACFRLRNAAAERRRALGKVKPRIRRSPTAAAA